MDKSDPVHPNAPAGGGGPGAFRGAGPTGMNPAFDNWMGRGPLGSAAPPIDRPLAHPPNPAAQYEVKQGDSLWAIAARTLGSGRFANDLAKLNGISPDALLHIGQRLIVPNYQRDDLTVAFMCNEMLRNANGAEANAIAGANQRGKQFKDTGDKAIADMKKSSWYEVFRNVGNHEILNAAVKQQGVAAAEAQGRWFIQVRQGGPWDHKPRLRKMYEAMPIPPRPFGTMGKAFHFPIRGGLFHEYGLIFY